MAFPTETIEQTRRRILENCQDHIRRSLDSLREICLMISAYQRGDETEVFQHNVNVMKNDETATEMKRSILKEIAEEGAMLVSREDFIHLSSHVNLISGYCTGISYRLMELTKRKWEAEKMTIKGLESLAEAVLNCVIRLKETIFALSLGGPKVFEASKNVEAAERIVDSIHRKVDLNIISGDMKLPLIFLLKEVAQYLENIANISEEANDIVKILAITT